MVSEDDFLFPLTSRRRAEDILFAKKASYHIQVFSGVEHGFAVRGNPEVENERTYHDFYLCLDLLNRLKYSLVGWAMEESARGIVNWFNRFTALKIAT
jgi:hypothetical protein